MVLIYFSYKVDKWICLLPKSEGNPSERREDHCISVKQQTLWAWTDLSICCNLCPKILLCFSLNLVLECKLAWCQSIFRLKRIWFWPSLSMIKPLLLVSWWSLSDPCSLNRLGPGQDFGVINLVKCELMCLFLCKEK